jgi:hypothetical protein
MNTHGTFATPLQTGWHFKLEKEFSCKPPEDQYAKKYYEYLCNEREQILYVGIFFYLHDSRRSKNPILFVENPILFNSDLFYEKLVTGFKQLLENPQTAKALVEEFETNFFISHDFIEKIKSEYHGALEVLLREPLTVSPENESQLLENHLIGNKPWENTLFAILGAIGMSDAKNILHHILVKSPALAN